MLLISQPTMQFANPRLNTPVASGKMYFGEPNTDPKVEENRVDVYYIDLLGNTVVLPQPVRLSESGVPIYLDRAIEVLSIGAVSIRVDDRNDIEVYLIDSFSGTDTMQPAMRSIASVDELRNAKARFNGEVIRLVSYHEGLNKGSGDLVGTFSESPVDDNGVNFAGNETQWSRQLDGFVTPEMFGAYGNGVADDTTAMQSILDNGYVAKLTKKSTYNITSSLRYKRGGGFSAENTDWYPETPQSLGRVFEGSVIKWAGTLSSGAMILMSATDIGVEQSSAFNDSVFGASLNGVVLDGNNLIDYGLYAYRSFGADVQNIVATRTNKHGIYGTALYSGTWRKLMGWKNNGCGITLGRGQVDFGFTIGQLNAVTLEDIWGYSNGYDGQFNEITNPAHGYGVGIWPHRGNFMQGIRSENNDGANIYFCPTSWGNELYQSYTELGNSLDIGGGATAITQGRASAKISLIIEGYAGGVSYGNSVSVLSVAGEKIKLIGINPSASRYGERLILRRISGSTGIDAGWDSYRIEDCNADLYNNISGSAPSPMSSTVNGYLVPDLQVAGYVTFTESSGVMTILNSYNVSSVTGTVGNYNINWDLDITTPNYPVIPSCGDNRIVGVVSRTGPICNIRHRTPAGALIDATGPVTIIAYGRVAQ